MIFEILYISQARTAISHKWKINEEPYHHLSWLPWECFHTTVLGGKTRQRSMDSLSYREGRESTKTLMDRKERLKGESFTKRKLWKCTESQSQVLSLVLTSVCMWGKYLRPGKEPLKGLERTVPNTQTGAGEVPVPISQTRKPWVEHTKWLCFSNGE